MLALRKDPPSVELSGALRNEYFGRYALDPKTTYEIVCIGGRLEGRRENAKSEELRAEAPDVSSCRAGRDTGTSS